ncbi:MAG: hypothetical protein HY282_14370 [Nitrospirae bacterium]|nr:hypothetical protein [Candidatus Manganitrophaceae bacterium]
MIKLSGFTTLSDRPPTTEVLTTAPAVDLTDPHHTATSNMTIQTTPGGARVFATGSIQWSWGLDDYNVPARAPPG